MAPWPGKELPRQPLLARHTQPHSSKCYSAAGGRWPQRVQGHVGQDEEGGGAQGEVEVELDHAASEGDDPVEASRSESILGTAVMVTRISSREKLPRKEVHGRVEVGVNKDHDSDDCVSYEGKKIKHKEGPVEQDLQFAKREKPKRINSEGWPGLCYDPRAGSLRGKETRH